MRCFIEKEESKERTLGIFSGLLYVEHRSSLSDLKKLNEAIFVNISYAVGPENVETCQQR